MRHVGSLTALFRDLKGMIQINCLCIQAISGKKVLRLVTLECTTLDMSVGKPEVNEKAIVALQRGKSAIYIGEKQTRIGAVTFSTELPMESLGSGESIFIKLWIINAIEQVFELGAPIRLRFLRNMESYIKHEHEHEHVL